MWRGCCGWRGDDDSGVVNVVGDDDSGVVNVVGDDDSLSDLSGSTLLAA